MAKERPPALLSLGPHLGAAGIPAPLPHGCLPWLTAVRPTSAHSPAAVRPLRRGCSWPPLRLGYSSREGSFEVEGPAEQSRKMAEAPSSSTSEHWGSPRSRGLPDGCLRRCQWWSRRKSFLPQPSEMKCVEICLPFFPVQQNKSDRSLA